MRNAEALPVIILPGIGQSKVVVADENGERLRGAWPLEIDPDAVNALKGPLMKTMLFRRDLGFTDRAAEMVRQITDPVATLPDGTMKHRVRVVEYPNALADCTPDEKRYINRMVPCEKLAGRIGEDKIYFFAYNSFGEPYETAAALDGYIRKVKAAHGCRQVNLLPVSMGGALATAYFDAYGARNDVKRVMYFVAALNGSALAADVLSGNVNAEDPSGLIAMFASRKKAASLKKLTAMMPAGVPEKLVRKALAAAAETAAVNSPAIWSVVPSDRYEELRDRLLRAPEKAALREKTDRFFAAQRRLPEIVAQLRENGTEFFSCVGYGLPLIGLSRSDTLSSDTIVNLSSASPGVRAAPPGQKLPKDAAGEFVSPDRAVDVENALFPDTVWYFAGQDHEGIAENETALEIAARVLSDDRFKNVYSDPAFPRFGNAEKANTQTL